MRPSTMKNAISCKQNEIILTCHVEITRDVPRYIAKKVYGGKWTSLNQSIDPLAIREANTSQENSKASRETNEIKTRGRKTQKRANGGR